MKKNVLSVLLLAMLLVVSFQPTLNVAAADEKTATLDELKFAPGKGWAVVFSITGKWTRNDLRGNTMVVDGHLINLYCSFRDANHISCTMVTLAPYIGMNATIYFAGWTYSAVVPPRRGGTGFAECPSDTWETVYVVAIDSEGGVHTGNITYPADVYTIDQAAAILVSLIEQFDEVEIVSYSVSKVTCGEPREN